MLPVSEAYKQSMKSLMRNQGYIRVVFGFDNSVTQSKASISGDMDPYSNITSIFKGGTDDFVYASLEENFIKIGSGMLFPPPLNSYWTNNLKEKAFISEDLVSDAPAVVTISFSETVTVDKIIFNFGDNYPVAFSITNGEDVCEIEDNDQRIVEVEFNFGAVTELTLTVTEMKSEETRLRIYSIDFASHLIFENDKVIDSNLDNSMSPINESLPQRNFFVTLVNENHQFDLDNPKSELNFLDTSTMVTVYYGYQLDDNSIEWLKYSGLYCYDWDADQDTATVNARDILQTLEKTYVGGTFTSTSLYNLAVAVLTYMGISDYFIHDDLKDISTTNPLPMIDCKECLQIIANAAGKKLMLKNDGSVSIGDNDNYTITLSSNGDLYGKLNTILNDDTKYVYAELEDDFIEIGNGLLFPPASSLSYINVGFVSVDRSANSGYFSGAQGNMNEIDPVLNGNLAVLTHVLSEDIHDITEPYIDISFSDTIYKGGIRIVFGATICEIFEVELYRDGTLIDTCRIEDNTSQEATVWFNIYLMDEIKLRFIKTCKPRNRVRVNYFELLGDINYKITADDMLGYAKFTKFSKVKEIVVPYYNYKAGASEEVLAEEELTDINLDTIYSIQMSEPCSAYRLSVSVGAVSIVESSAYMVKFRFAYITGTTSTVTVYGKKHTKTERNVVKTLNTDGEIIEWSNPLVNSKEMADDLANHLAEYYSIQGSYSFESRGDPSMEVNDVIRQEHWSGKDLSVLVIDLSLGFNGGFSGNITTLRLGEA